MPELPEVETVMRGLSPVLCDNKIKKIDLHRPNLRIPFPKNMQRQLSNKKIISLQRRAKYIFVLFDGGKILVIHLGMSGRILIIPHNEQYELQKHDHMVLTMNSGDQIVYNDPRRFGMVFIVEEDELETHKIFSRLGPEPLSNNFSAAYLIETLKSKNTSIKQALLDQHVVVGVGNIYACEALYQSKINPTAKASSIKGKKADSLVRAIRDVLTRAIKAGGSTLKDYRHADGELGYFQHSFTVYGQDGEACPDCDCNIAKTGGVKRMVQSGRSTFYCPRQQK